MKRQIIWVGVLVLFISSGLYAQNTVPKDSSKSKTEKNFRFLPLPYLNFARSIGLSYGVLPIALYKLSKKDTVSPSSISGALVMGTTNGTWLGMGFTKLYLFEDRYRSIIVGGVGTANYQFYPNLPFVPEVINYSTRADFFLIDLQRKIVPNLYAGLGYMFINLATDFDINFVPTQFATLHGLSVPVSFDSRENVYYPKNGILANLSYNAFPKFIGNAEESHKIEFDYNHYFEMNNERDVIAARAFIGFGLGELNFNQQFIVGWTDLRGYSQGEFRGEQLYAVQGEYRWNLLEKFGLVGFAGVATVFQSLDKSDDGKLLPSIGGGFRLKVFPDQPMNIGLDAAVGLNDWSIDFRISEAF